ncbi:hypothetical protein l13_09840 [Neisseria weaveri ATCC 51223]|nr:hypothetical protein l13_09840 [Neisseria weaveri ATCC 51223]
MRPSECSDGLFIWFDGKGKMFIEAAVFSDGLILYNRSADWHWKRNS